MPKKNKKISVDTYLHNSEKRKNNPPVGLVSSVTDKLDGQTEYQHDPHIDPYLSWAGKQEGNEFEVQNVSLHIHERIDPQRIVKSFLKKEKEKGTIGYQQSLFEEPANEPPLNKAIDFYQHEQDWTNRLIAGDSLLVMNSLLNKEGMAGKMQMIYIDPPYGISYNSNFQPFTNKRNVKDNNDDDIPAEPETIKAFRDTWQLEIHSYLTHLRDRLLLAKEMLTDSGSCFVQISDENLDLVKSLMGEIFGKENLVSIITFRKTSFATSNTLPTVSDYLIWFAKDKEKVKYRDLFKPKPLPVKDPNFRFIELSDGTRRAMIPEERENPYLIPEGSRIYRYSDITSAGAASYDDSFEFNGEIFKPGSRHHWKTSLEGMQQLAKLRRIEKFGKKLAYVKYFDDFGYQWFDNMWDDTGTGGFGDDKIYVVQTTQKTIQRCLLMTTDPGDLVFDPTCGSGTTAVVAEQWGRRWITCDTSRVAITLAKQRLMTAYFDYYELAHPTEGIASGFEYKKISHVTLGAIANSASEQERDLYDQPVVKKDIVRVTGPFTVEAVPSLRIRPFDGQLPRIETNGSELARAGETGTYSIWLDELKATGIRTVGGRMINFSTIEPMKATRFLHARGEILNEKGANKKVVISFGSEYGPLEQRQVEEAIKEARSLDEKPDFIVFAAFHFDPEAAKDIDQIDWSEVQILKTQMSVDLLTHDLRKKKRGNQSYWLIGQPDIDVEKLGGDKYKVKVNGFDYYDPISGEIESKSEKHIAMWFLDTDYDERSLLPDQVFFPQKDPKRDWTKLAKTLNGEVDEDLVEAFTGIESLLFKAGEQKKIAVKIIDNRGIESLVIKKLE